MAAILLAEDERAINNLMAANLRLVGHQCDQAFTGQVFGDVAAVLFVFSSVGSFARYRTDRDRFFLGMGIFTGALCLGSLGWYIWHTL